MTKAKLSEKIGYGFGDMSSSMFWKIFSYYLPFFYSNIFGLSLAHAGTLLLVTKLYDAISDPVMGLIADRTSTRWGKYRPYLLWIALPFAIAGILAFYTPQTDNYTFKHIYAYVTYILMMTVYTAINVPYGAMLGVVTDDSREKSVFSSFRMFFAFIGSFISMGIFEPLLRLRSSIMGTLPEKWTIADSAPLDWTIALTVIGTICAILFFLTFAMTREHVTESEMAKAEVTHKEEKKNSIMEDLKALFCNAPWWLLLGGGISLLLFNCIRGGAAAYYFADVLGVKAIYTLAIFLTVGEISQLVGVVVTVPISEKIGKKATFIAVLVAITIFAAAWPCFLRPLPACGCSWLPRFSSASPSVSVHRCCGQCLQMWLTILNTRTEALLPASFSHLHQWPRSSVPHSEAQSSSGCSWPSVMTMPKMRSRLLRPLPQSRLSSAGYLL